MRSASTACNHGSAWFALRVRSNCERRVRDILRAKEVKEFLPIYHSRRVWADRVRELDRPLFPGYVFCQVSPPQRSLALATTGVVSMVGVHENPIPIPDEEIEAVRRVVESGRLLEVWPLVRIGQRIRVHRGPLAGVEGTLLKIQDRSRVAVSISLLGRSVLTQIDTAYIRPA
jgi:transcription antitermination factor NusG